MQRPDAGLLRDFFDYWQTKRGERAMPAREHIDPIDIPRMLPHVFLVDVLTDEDDFRYRLIGDSVRSQTQDNYIGRRLTEIVDREPQRLLLELYRETVRNRAPRSRRLSYTAPGTHLTRHYDVLVAPLSPDGDAVSMLFGIAVYEGK